MKILLIVVSIIFIISALAPLSKREEWWIRGFDFPYLQFTVLGIWAVIEWVGFHHPVSILEWIICVLTVGLVVYRLTVIYPYTRLMRPTLPNSDEENSSIRIVSTNVLMSNDDYDGCLKVIDEVDPDIVFLVEVDDKWEQTISKQLNAKYPYRVLHALNNTYGMMLFSKIELENPTVKFLIEDNVPSIHAKLKLADSRKIQFYGLHPKPPAPGENDMSTPRDAELVIVGKEARNSELPVIVAGDMNDVAWSHTTRLFMRISGLLDPRMGRGFFNTFHAERPLLRWPLDHFFLSHHFRIKKLDRLDNFHSDHFPILVDVTINPSVHAKASIEHANGDDLDEAREKLDKIEG